MPPKIQLHCACGQVRLEATGDPITSTECHCASCRASAIRLQAVPNGPHLQEPNGGTRFVLYRKDRIDFLGGWELLESFRLSADAKTRRVIASCCNTPVFLEFENGHWLSLYGGLWTPETLPRLELRTMTSDLPDPSVLPDDVPNMRRQSGRFFVKLLGAWIAMGFRAPRLAITGEFRA
ncbi:hypothetical protein H0E84_08710 [Luteimonas sp. SJ-92]|uniref:CENP-V/GFA domain-containing protein n=1 Tax=Luteimonas salinisoli TaxID=2752307 RepID=A0A853JB51_9GAMM|nr:hypothetical protein [Luteimonas salinisoli]NZA26466.1 hypothetical protein [Luteimonas salinisoli]